MLTCARCKKEKNEEDFPIRKDRKRGRDYRCISCDRKKRKNFEREVYSKKIPKEEFARRNHENYLKHKDWFKKRTESFKKSFKYEVMKKYRSALQQGVIKNPGTCSSCLTSNSKIHGHHEDYSKPLDVIWLCAKCHRRVHLEKVTP